MAYNQKQVISLFGAYTLWSLLPFYLKVFSNMSYYEIIAHRLFWSFIVLVLFFSIWKRKAFFEQCKKITFRSFYLLSLSGFLITCNWLIYIYSIQRELLLQSSLGYFISPLLSILMGWLLLKEKISRLQGFSVILSALGVGYLIFFYHQVPWIAMILAFTFGGYSIVHKKIKLESSFMLFLETLVLLPFTLGYLLLLARQQELFFLANSWQYDIGIVGLGVISSVPLILFSYALKGLSFLVIGFVQFYMPSILFLISVFVFDEYFGIEYRITFILIWTSVILFIFSYYKQAHTKKYKKILAL